MSIKLPLRSPAGHTNKFDWSALDGDGGAEYDDNGFLSDWEGDDGDTFLVIGIDFGTT